jgi:hypothetical protein
VNDPQLDELHAFSVSAIRRLFAKVLRLESQVKRQQRLIAEQRYVIHMLYGWGDWKMVGEGKHRHLNRKGTSYMGVLERDTDKVIMTSARQCRIVDDAMVERKRSPLG